MTHVLQSKTSPKSEQSGVMTQNKNEDKPLVVVTGPAKRMTVAWWATHLMLKLVGCRGHYVTAQEKSIPPSVSGVIIGGGNDIDPVHYGAIGDGGANYDAQRDLLEMAMVRQACESQVPILGICRGAQLINVVLGGTLHIDIRPKRRHTPNKNSIFGVKWADIAPGSRLSSYLKRQSVRINSLHNQAVNQVADPLVAVAHDYDGFIQAIESKADQSTLPWITGVQWHPEYMPYARAHRRLFKAFAKEVRAAQRTLNTTQPVRF